MQNLTVTVSGGPVSGKSTVIALLAQVLRGLDYNVQVPKHLIGLGIHEEALSTMQCETTNVRFVEKLTSHRPVVGDMLLILPTQVRMKVTVVTDHPFADRWIAYGVIDSCHVLSNGKPICIDSEYVYEILESES